MARNALTAGNALVDILAAQQYQGRATGLHVAHYKRVLRALDFLNIDDDARRKCLEHYVCYHINGAPIPWLAKALEAAKAKP